MSLLRLAIPLLGGGVAGLVAAVLALQVRLLRNHLFARRGEAGIKDCILPMVFVPLGAIGGLVVAAVRVRLMAPLSATIVGASVPAGSLVLISVGSSIAQLVR